MKDKRVLTAFTFLFLMVAQGVLVELLAQEKLKYGTGVKLAPYFYLPPLAGEEKGFWKQNGLEVEWVPFAAGSAMYQGFAAGSINIGAAGSTTHLQGVAGGVPAIIVASLVLKEEFILVVRADSSVRDPKGLKGAKVGLSRFGSSPHIYGQIAFKALGMERDTKFVTVGGIPQAMAALKTGAVDGFINAVTILAGLLVGGEARQLMSVSRYLPEDWVDMVIAGRVDFLKARPDTARRMVKAFFQIVDFLEKNPEWAMEKMKAMQGYSEAVGRVALKGWIFSKDGKISRSAMENVRSTVIEYGIVPKDKTPPVEELFTGLFTG